MNASESIDGTARCPRVFALILALMLGLAVIGLPMLAHAAGEVRVEQVSGELRIKGDAAANLISLVDEGETVIIGSFDPTGKINGVPGPFFARGVEEITAEMGAGDDYVTLVDIFFTVGVPSGDLRIATGSGNDTINAEDSSARALTIVTGAGDDVVLWDGGRCGPWTVHTGAGADEMWISSFEVSGKAVVDTGSGPDLVSTFVETFRDVVELATGAGNDTIVLTSSLFDGDVSLNGGSGADALDEDSTFNGALTVENFEQ